MNLSKACEALLDFGGTPEARRRGETPLCRRFLVPSRVRELRGFDRSVVVGLLEDIHRAYDGVAVEKKTPSSAAHGQQRHALRPYFGVHRPTRRAGVAHVSFSDNRSSVGRFDEQIVASKENRSPSGERRAQNYSQAPVLYMGSGGDGCADIVPTPLRLSGNGGPTVDLARLARASSATCQGHDDAFLDSTVFSGIDDAVRGSRTSTEDGVANVGDSEALPPTTVLVQNVCDASPRSRQRALSFGSVTYC